MIRVIICHFWNLFNKNFNKELADKKNKDCSLANAEIVGELIPWMSSKTYPKDVGLSSKIDVIHDFFFHEHNENYNLYPNIDAEYKSTIQELISKLFDRPDPLYDQIIIMSDHGPRTEKFGTLNSGDKLLSSSLKFDAVWSYWLQF